MNNNRINNRRRGRGGNRQQGGGQPLNRIDSRARGNAPQLLEKYRKLAQDAHMNGDRVSAEYYFQFADHYFRVIADSRQRQEEQRRPRDDRFPETGYDDGDEGEFAGESEFGGGYDQAPPYRRDEQRPEQRSEQRPPRRDEPRAEREHEPEPAPAPAPQVEAEDRNPFEPAGGNPFTRDNRAIRGLKPRREFRGEREDAPPPAALDDNPAEPAGIEPTVLPPAIGEARDAAAAADDEAPAPRRRGRPRRRPADEPGGDPLEAVGG